MCTAAAFKTKDFYFGRTLDNDISYGEEVVITPRKYPFTFRSAGTMNSHYAIRSAGTMNSNYAICSTGTMKSHYAIIGMACVEDNYPLYYDAVNEKGLGMAGLNFVGNADYKNKVEGMCNISQFEFIPWVLGQCATVSETKKLLEQINLVNIPFKAELPLAQLHWLIADSSEAITVESTKTGFHVYDNPVGVLTNNPPFKEQMFQLNNYMHLSAKAPQNNFSSKLPLRIYSRGMGALGLPGDLSSQSRFVRAAFVKLNSVSGDSETESVGQFFHILGSVEQQRGCCDLGNGKYEITIYTSCCNANKGIYYYTTYGNHQITAVNMHHENLDSSRIARYPLIQKEQIRIQKRI